MSPAARFLVNCNTSCAKYRLRETTGRHGPWSHATLPGYLISPTSVSRLFMEAVCSARNASYFALFM